MYRLAMLTLVATLLAAFGSGCGEVTGADPDAAGSGPSYDASTPDAEGPTQIGLDEMCDPDTGLFVDLFVAMLDCSPEYDLLLGGIPGPDTLSTMCEAQFGHYVDDGSVELGDTAALAACRTFIDDLTCYNFSFDMPLPDDCEAIIQGTVELDGDCDSNDQCAGNAYCDRDNNQTCGTCTEQLPNGEPCRHNSQCRGGRCLGTTDGGGSSGSSGTCGAFGAVGASCTLNEDCMGRLVCDRSSNTCAQEPSWQPGDSCAQFPADCDALVGDAYCDAANLGGSMVCVAYLDLGDACGAADSPLCRIFEYESCQNVGTGYECVAATIVDPDDTCGYIQGAKCPDGYSCADHDSNGGTQDTCVATRTEGQSCNDSDLPCGAFLECRDAGTCEYSNYSGMCPAP